ncbi:MAG: permease-like cell division protein FtsX [Fimbriimonadaceae bacterium]
MLDRIEFIIAEAFVALRRNSLMSLAAVTTVAVSLFFLGGLGYVYLRLQTYAEALPDQLDARVHLKMEITEQARFSEIADRIRALPGVKTVQHIPRDAAWKRDFAKYGYKVDDLGDNPYSDAYKVTWGDLSKAESTAKVIKAMPEVEEVVQETEVQRMVSDFLDMLTRVGIGLGGILLITGGILIYNAIKLTIISRRREIRIMQLVGARRATITTPFLIEGVVQGALGGTLAACILWAAQIAIKNYVDYNVKFIQMPDDFPVGLAFGALAAAGALYGFICSLIAVREPTRFR